MWKRIIRRKIDPFEAIVARLPIHAPFDLDRFLESLAVERNRPLILIELKSTEALPCGIWVSTEEADRVYYARAADPLLRTQIILHEVSHMLLNHRGPAAEQQVIDEAGMAALAALSSDGQRYGTHPAATLRAEADRIRAQAAAVRATDDELGIDPAAWLALLARTTYSGQEADAERLASLIHEAASRSEAKSRTADGEEVLGRLDAAFGHPAT
ncbi:hypothetical protein ACN20G_33680 (plasmid) [Streptomyces sp. BI20]|uniref:hypothetical protein n=1 Tax=Streptomyces sp. BI20 TaxID=3403460 RepID=UPI003C72DE8B